MKQVIQGLAIFFAALVGISSQALGQLQMESETSRAYSLGLEFGVAADISGLSYDAEQTAETPKACRENGDGKMRCTTVVVPTKASGIMVSMSKPTLPTGPLFFDYGLRLGLRFVNGQDVKTAAEEHLDEEQKEDLGPVNSAKINMYGPLTKLYLSLGFTPDNFPDTLVHFGVGAQALFGTIEVNDHQFRRAFISPLGFFEFEAVWMRLGAGSVSSYVAVDFPLGPQNIDLGTVDGYSNFELKVFGVSVGVLRFMIPLG
ncbi:MAG: hypothetical protein AB7T49_18420 [Oligoflexales bacterium]